MQPNLLPLRSAIYSDDAVENTLRRFGAAKRYYVAELVPEGGVPADPIPLLFTQADIDGAAERAAKNQEDVERAYANAVARSDGWPVAGVLAIASIALAAGTALGALLATVG